MAANITKKRTHLSLEQKISAIKQLDQGKPAYKLAQELGVGKTQVQNLRKRKAELLKDYENNVSSQSKRRRYLTGNEEINNLVFEWFKDTVSRRINVTGPLIQTKALQFASDLQKHEFKASNGWLESFVKRHNIVFGNRSGERGDVKISTVNDWKSKLNDLCADYTPDNIFNMDETGLFFRDTKTKTFHFKGDDCAGGKRSKERLTVALCASQTGEKLKPLVIGKSRSPRCFGKINIKELPVDYYYNKKAWMNSKIFEDFVQNVNKKMKAQNRHIMLFIDNAPSHPEFNLSNVKLQFLPPNTTSYTQPMDQGIIQTMKLKFRKRQLLHIVKEMDISPSLCGTELLKQITCLDAIYWVSNAWKEVEAMTIQKCFHKAGFGASDTVSSAESGDHPEVLIHEDQEDDDDEIPLAAMKMSLELFGCPFKDLAEIDRNLISHDSSETDWNKNASDLLSDLNLLNRECLNQSDSDSEPENDETLCEPQISLSEVSQMMVKFKLYARQSGNSKIMDLLSHLDDEVNVHASGKTKQTKISEFFKPRSAI